MFISLNKVESLKRTRFQWEFYDVTQDIEKIHPAYLLEFGEYELIN